MKVHLHIWNTSTVHFYLSQSAVTSHPRELRVWICCAVFTNMYVRCFCERSVCAAELHQRLWRGKMLPHDLGSLRESSTSFLSACSDLLLTLFLEQVCSGSRLWAQGRTLTHTHRAVTSSVSITTDKQPMNGLNARDVTAMSLLSAA